MHLIVKEYFVKLISICIVNFNTPLPDNVYGERVRKRKREKGWRKDRKVTGVSIFALLTLSLRPHSLQKSDLNQFLNVSKT